MELAGLACAQSLATVYRKDVYPRVLVCCGPGNQGEQENAEKGRITSTFFRRGWARCCSPSRYRLICCLNIKITKVYRHVWLPTHCVHAEGIMPTSHQMLSPYLKLPLLLARFQRNLSSKSRSKR